MIATGASLGANHAVTFGLRYPESVGRILGMSGLYDLKQMTGGYSDENVYACQSRSTSCATSTTPGGSRRSGGRTSSWRSAGAIRCTATTGSSPALLWSKGIGNALRIWDGHAHDWPYWEKMVRSVLGGA